MEVELVFLMSSAEQLKFEWQLFALFGVIPGAFLFRACKLGYWRRVRVPAAIYAAIYLYLIVGRLIFAYEVDVSKNLKPFVYNGDKFFKTKTLEYETGNWVLIGLVSERDFEIDMQDGLFCQSFLSFTRSSELKLSSRNDLFYSIEIDKDFNPGKVGSDGVLEVCPKKIFIYRRKK